jgi:hypothetical protein
MERRKLYIVFFVLVVLTMITSSVYRLATKKAESYNFNQAKLYVESFGWKTGFLTSTDIRIDEKAHLDFDNFRYRKTASLDIGLDYLKFKDKEVKLYAFAVGKEYQGEPIYAHVLIYKGEVIGAYLQSQVDNLGDVYVFSLRDREFQFPNLN